nr:hypothetical protein [Oceanococcus sp. HetDA_MAG_MS8]
MLHTLGLTRRKNSSEGVGTLILHIGGGKTGSSFLQSKLAQNSELLKHHGVLYKSGPELNRALSGQVTSGNGAWLSDYLCHDEKSRESSKALDLLLDQASKPFEDVVLSSEKLQHFSPNRMFALHDKLKKEGRKLHVVYFTRSVAGRAYSAYRQRVKRHLEKREFSTWLKRYKHNCIAITEKLESSLPKESFSIRNYDYHRTSMFGFFCSEFLRIDQVTKDQGTEEQLVNRSLNHAETEIMRTLNGYVRDEKVATTLGHALIASESIGGEPSIQMKDVKYLESQFSEKIAIVNRYLPDEEKASVVGPNDLVSEDKVGSSLTEIDIHQLRLIAAIANYRVS